MVSIEALLAADRETAIEAVDGLRPSRGGARGRSGGRGLGDVPEAEASLAVVDAEGRFVGLIPPDRMLEVLLAEHDEDLARIGGFMAGTGARAQRRRGVRARRLYHRLPWLLLGLARCDGSALLVGAFEEELDKKVLLAFFVPAVVYMADAVGTQTEAVLIRGLSVGVTVGEVARARAGHRCDHRGPCSAPPSSRLR